MADQASPEDQFNLDPVLFSGFERLQALQLRPARVRKAEAEAAIKEAEATAARHRAALEPERQRLELWERRTRLALAVLASLFGMVYLVAVLLVAPWVIAPTGVLATFAYLRRR